ncbi:hypothetical protein SAMN05216327_109135 [Dyadobacter sp. SG02]|nr:hypothetical protein SAMN05216327_109135 [Dyadobacter sp. SG02]
MKCSNQVSRNPGRLTFALVTMPFQHGSPLVFQLTLLNYYADTSSVVFTKLEEIEGSHNTAFMVFSGFSLSN